MRIQRGFEDNDRFVAAQMFWSAFRGKLGLCLGPERKAVPYIARVIQPKNAFAAYAGNRLIGLVGLKTNEGGLIVGDGRDLEQVYGRVSGALRGVILNQFERIIEADQLFIDGLFVQSDMRGEGVGAALLDAVDDFAMAEFYTEIRLDVVDGNPHARRLYERRGYEADGWTKTGLMRPVLGFKSSTTMVKTL